MSCAVERPAVLPPPHSLSKPPFCHSAAQWRNLLLLLHLLLHLHLHFFLSIPAGNLLHPSVRRSTNARVPHSCASSCAWVGKQEPRVPHVSLLRRGFAECQPYPNLQASKNRKRHGFSRATNTQPKKGLQPLRYVWQSTRTPQTLSSPQPTHLQQTKRNRLGVTTPPTHVK
jgi:hypothetical protein